MDKKFILGAGLNYDKLNRLPSLHIQRKKQPKLLELFAKKLGEEKALKLFKNEVKNLFQNKFTGRSDYDAVKREIAKKIFLYNLSKLKNKKLQDTSEKGVSLNVFKW